MSQASGGAAKVFRGVAIAAVLVAMLVLVAAFRDEVLAGLRSAGRFLSDQFPAQPDQQSAVIGYLVIAIVLSVLFSKAGHFTAYGIVMGLGPLLWALFWEGFPPLGVDPSWVAGLGIDHLAPTPVLVWAVVADVVITIVFVPLELREKARVRRRSQGGD